MMPKISYDKEADILSIVVSDERTLSHLREVGEPDNTHRQGWRAPPSRDTESQQDIITYG